MKLLYTSILMSLFLVEYSAQSPFNYGQNEEVYFISLEELDSMEISEFIEVYNFPDGETGGMHEEWDVIIQSFLIDGFESNWHILNEVQDSEIQVEEVIEEAYFINGTVINITEDGQLDYYGGYGYGSFNSKYVTERNDSTSFINCTCTGHCAAVSPENESKNNFNDKGQLTHIYIYPEYYPELDLMDEELHEESYEADFDINNSDPTDTIYYSYDSEGLLSNFDGIIVDKNNLTNTLFYGYSNPQGSFYQMYIDHQKMEQVIESKIGYLPKLILVEIYQYGICSFLLDIQDRKYYTGEIFILEQ